MLHFLLLLFFVFAIILTMTERLMPGTILKQGKASGMSESQPEPARLIKL
jgi:hypothetical protein